MLRGVVGWMGGTAYETARGASDVARRGCHILLEMAAHFAAVGCMCCVRGQYACCRDASACAA
jgi:hypothetical protein